MDYLTIVQFACGLALLLFSGYWLIPASVSSAHHMGIPPRLIASLIIAGGTSAPELLVSLDAGFSGNADIAWGNILGSNIANIFLVGGLGLLILPITIDAGRDRKDISWLAGMTVLAALIIYADADGGMIRYASGAMLLLLFILHTRISAKAGTAAVDETPEPSPQFGLAVAIVTTLASIAGLVFGADLMVVSGVLIAQDFGVEQAVIGVTIVAIGTSLPEIAAVTASLLNRRSDMALGNIIGSNMFNLGIVLGLTLMATPLSASHALLQSNMIFFLSSMLVMAMLIFTQARLGTKTGAGFILIYILFLILEFYS